jgi:hypothetical protein
MDIKYLSILQWDSFLRAAYVEDLSDQHRDLVIAYNGQQKNIGSQVAMLDARIEAVEFGLDRPDDSLALEASLQAQYGRASAPSDNDFTVGEPPPPEESGE